MKKLKEIAFFESLLETPRNELVEKAIEQGRKAIGMNCWLVPEPLLSAGNVFPVYLTAPDISDTTEADYYLSNVLCTYAKSIFQEGFNDSFDFCSAMIFVPTCDQIRRAGHLLQLVKVNGENDKFFIYPLETPHKDSLATNKWCAQDMRKFAAKMNETYDANINEDTIRQAIKEFNEFNELMRSISDFRKGDNPKITGTEWITIYGATKVAPKDLLIEPLKAIKAEIEAREEEKNNKRRIMVVGSTIDKPKFIELIEAQGAIVVADRHCFGSLPGMEPIKEEGDPFQNLADHYLKTCKCPRMLGKGLERRNYSLDLIKEFKVEGVIFTQVTFCDLWGFESVTYVEDMKNANIPIVTIAREYSVTGEGQIATRVQAFVESINDKRDKTELASK